jgi:hypothetical protein
VRNKIRHRLLIAGVASMLGACGSATDVSVPPTPAAAFRTAAISGTSQRAFAGETLAEPVVVQVDSGGRPVAAGRRVRFSIAIGGGSVSETIVATNAEGRAAVTWRLGNLVGVQELNASLADDPSATPTSIIATGVSPSAADLVVVRGATPGGTVRLLVREESSSLSYTLTWPDTVLRLLPHEPTNVGPASAPAWQEVTAFSLGHAPATAPHPWTSDADTVELTLRAPIAVPFTVWVTHDFDTTAVRARYELANLDVFWRSNMTGLRVGTVRIENVPELVGTLELCSDERRRFDQTAMNVYYMNTMIDGRAAITCDATTVIMGMTTIWSFSTVYAYLLAHEVGHALSLNHVPDAANHMNGSPGIGSRITTGQIYRMHFHYWGTLNSVLKVHPVGERNCNLPISRCPAETFEGW